jgi:hypothetical protein
MKKMTLNYYQDPSHGWVKIKRDKLIKLHIEHLISSYSYQYDDSIYLEEDNDLATLYKACDELQIKITLREYHTNRSSKIRSYDQFKSKVRATIEQNATLNLWNT